MAALPKYARIGGLLLLVALTGGSVWLYLALTHQAGTSTLTLYGNVDIREVQPAFNDSGRVTAMLVLVQEGAAVHKGDLIARWMIFPMPLIWRRPRPSREPRRNAGEIEGRIAAGGNRASQGKHGCACGHAGERQDELRAHGRPGPHPRHLEAATRRGEGGAPEDGIIENRILEPGDMAAPNTPVYTMALYSPLWIRAYVTETDLGKVAYVMHARITTDSFPGHVYRGWIGYISPTAEFTPKSVETTALRTALVYQLRVYVCDSRNQLRLGMPATVQIDLSPPAPEARAGCGSGDAASP